MNKSKNVKIMKPAKLSSVFEGVANLKKITSKGVNPTICSESNAKLIAESNPFQQVLPEIKIISPCPVITELDGSLTIITGYNRHTGIYASGVEPELMEIEKAVACLLALYDDFDFVTDADKARGIASIITPALVAGGLLGGRAPIDLGEANESQSGKGYRLKIIAATYNCKLKTVTQKKGGVGSMEESLNTALVSGAFFIVIDNLRGKIDSPALESFLTEDSYSARIPHQAAMDIDPSNHIIMMTSNKADFTVDLANRTSATRIRKKPDGYQFRRYPEGNIIDHIKANQALYLGAVFTVISVWFNKGKSKTDETRHDFREWVQTLDWICQILFKTCPIMDGHRESQERITNPNLNWLRGVSLIISRSHPNTWLKSSEILSCIEFEGIEIPGLIDGIEVDDDNINNVWMAIGRKISQCFRNEDKVEIDDMVIVRKSIYNDFFRKEQPVYLFALISELDPPEDLDGELFLNEFDDDEFDDDDVDVEVKFVEDDFDF